MKFRGAHACGVLVAAFCGDELQSSLWQNATARTLQACASQN
jgi:hypothetical protein